GGQSDVQGLFYGGGLDQFWKQCAGVFAVLAYSLVASAVLAFLVEKTIGMRVSPDDEIVGVDQVEHAETAYDFSDVSAYGPSWSSTGTSTPGRTAPLIAADTGMATAATAPNSATGTLLEDAWSREDGA
ncbi:hypothetical protein G5C60_38850, partial [Streptomyces sp. HC44]|nr:hypothetical protein [Streptomyces scabichelini]